MDEGSSKVSLGDNDLWLEFCMGEQAFEIEAFEALDLLAEIDVKHKDDPHYCADCKIDFQSDGPNVEDGRIYCPKCGKCDCVKPSQLFLDDVSALLIRRFGLARCSRQSSAQFYNCVVERTSEAKKNTMKIADLPIGME